MIPKRKLLGVAMASSRVPASSTPTRSKLQGWSAFSQSQSSAPHDFSDALLPPDPSQFMPLTIDQQGPIPPSLLSIPTFADALKTQDHLRSSHNPKFAADSGSHIPKREGFTLCIARLKSHHAWADENLLEDVLKALDFDEERTSAYLHSMAQDNSCEMSSSQDTCRGNLSEAVEGRLRSSQDEETCTTSSQEEEESFVRPRQDALELHFQGKFPLEPEFVQEDVYYLTRMDALKMSRSSRKNSKGAHKAFMDGDYNRANALSRTASEQRAEAERLHAEAANQIFLARNTDRNVWELDLHGLHVGEAVAALQQRLLYIETTLSSINCGQDGSNSSLFVDHRRSSSVVSEASSSIYSKGHQDTGSYKLNLNCDLPFEQKLKVVTGIGNHSCDGGSLPRAIKNFLLQNRYKLEESRPGMIEVKPKLHPSK